MSGTHLQSGEMSSKQYQRQCIVIHNRMTKRQQAIQELKQHLQNGTFPKRFNFLKPHPKMVTSEGQAKVKEALQQVSRAILDEKVQDYERKLQADRTSLQTLKDTRREQRKQKVQDTSTTIPKQSKKNRPTLQKVLQELRELQAKYTELSQQVIPQES